METKKAKYISSKIEIKITEDDVVTTSGSNVGEDVLDDNEWPTLFE